MARGGGGKREDREAQEEQKLRRSLQRYVKMGFCVYASNVIGKREERDIAKSI